jgi:potassium-transporting ATPase KdpC subunit
MLNLIRPAISLLTLLTVVTGVVYPFAVTGVAQLTMSNQANGSLIMRDGKVIGSELIGQSFTASENFWGRPSATSAKPYDAAASSGSNLGPTNPALFEAINTRIKTLRADGSTAPIPVDLVTASASGLDPHISVAAATYQVKRVAAARKLSTERVNALIETHTERPLLGFIGEARINVLTLNLALRELKAN